MTDFDKEIGNWSIEGVFEVVDQMFPAEVY